MAPSTVPTTAPTPILFFVSLSCQCYALAEQTVSDCMSHEKTTNVITGGTIKSSHLSVNLQGGITSHGPAARGASTSADIGDENKTNFYLIIALAIDMRKF